jgi:hypothetical protein
LSTLALIVAATNAKGNAKTNFTCVCWHWLLIIKQIIYLAAQQPKVLQMVCPLAMDGKWNVKETF